MALTTPTFPNLVVAFDIETSGRSLISVGRKPAGDCLFAIGIAWGQLHDTDRTKVDWVGKASIVLAPPKANKDLGALWANKGWDAVCGEFWKREEATLRKLWASSSVPHEFGCYERDWCRVVADYPAMASCLNKMLGTLEGMTGGEPLCVASDTMVHDFPWIVALLTQNGYQPLGYTRDGNWSNKSMHVGSFKRGVLCERYKRAVVDVTKEERGELEDQLAKRRPAGTVHMPADDAAGILFDTLVAQQAAAGKLDAPTSSS